MGWTRKNFGGKTIENKVDFSTTNTYIPQLTKQPTRWFLLITITQWTPYKSHTWTVQKGMDVNRPTVFEKITAIKHISANLVVSTVVNWNVPQKNKKTTVLLLRRSVLWVVREFVEGADLTVVIGIIAFNSYSKWRHLFRKKMLVFAFNTVKV